MRTLSRCRRTGNSRSLLLSRVRIGYGGRRPVWAAPRSRGKGLSRGVGKSARGWGGGPGGRVRGLAGRGCGRGSRRGSGLLGAEINAEAEQQTVRDSTAGPPQPLGRRGAVKADSIPTAEG